MAGKHTPTAMNRYATFAAVPGGWGVLLGMLYLVNPPRLMATFRQHLIRSAAKAGIVLEGQLFAVLHGAYDPATKSYPLHIHGIAIGGMVEVVDGLRHLRKYCPAQPHDGRDAANTPVWVSRGPLTNMPEPLTYVMKKHWQLRETYLDTDGRRKAYGGKATRIPKPAHSEYLQFLDRWRIEDVTLLMGMHATKNGLVLR